MEANSQRWVAVFVALRTEVSALIQSLTNPQHIDCQDGLSIIGSETSSGRILIIQTGMGRERLERAAGPVFNRFPLSAVISIGFSGALTKHLELGDLVVCDRLITSNPSYAGTIFSSDPYLISAALQIPMVHSPPLLGRALTVNRPVSNANTREALSTQYNADLVDMESFWAARLAAENNLPFLAVRVVSDVVRSPGILSMLEFVLHLPASRRRLSEFMRFFINTGLKGQS